MEEVKKELIFKKDKDKKKKKLNRGTDFGLKILAVICAVIIWFALSITQYPTINKTITNVPVVFSLDDTKAADKGLEALDYKDITVAVEIKGMNYEIGGYTADDLVATVNLDSVTKEGTYTLDIDVKSTHSTDKCTVVSVSPNTVQVDFDRITTKTFELTAESPLISAEEGYTLGEATIEPNEVTVEGAKNDIDNISKAVVQISKSKKITEDTTIQSSDVVFYDADDNKIDSSQFTIKDNKNFNVSFSVYKKKTANLKVDVTGCPDSFNSDTLPIILSTSSISVTTPNLEDSDNETISVGTIPLSNINLAKTYTFTIPLNTGETNLSGTDMVTVSFNSDGYTSKTFSISSSHIKLKNMPSNLKTTIETEKLTNVTMYGPEEIINTLANSDLYAVVDMSDIHDTGSYKKEATVYANDYNNVWCYGLNTVQVVVEQPSTDSDS